MYKDVYLCLKLLKLCVFVKVCSNNMYGLECVVFCGNCNDGKLCNNINGMCYIGCNEGVEGNIC